MTQQQYPQQYPQQMYQQQYPQQYPPAGYQQQMMPQLQPQQMPNEPKDSGSNRDKVSEAKKAGKKVIKPISAGKGFALGLLASFIMLITFSFLLILYSTTSTSSLFTSYSSALEEALNTIEEAASNATLTPTDAIISQALSSNVNIVVTVNNSDDAGSSGTSTSDADDATGDSDGATDDDTAAADDSTDATSNDNSTDEATTDAVLDEDADSVSGVTTVYGAGVIWSSNGHIVTNYHVIEDADEITVIYAGVEYSADVVGTDPTSDIAVIKINASDLTPVTLADSDTVSVGDWVMAIGNPYGLNDTLTVGNISATGRNDMRVSNGVTVLYANMIQTDAAINPGSSGGGLYNAAGQLIGITTVITSTDSGNQGIGYAIPTNIIESIASDLISGSSASHADMGVNVSDVTEDAVEAYGLTSTSGAYVTNVVTSGAADSAGVIQGDIIIGYNGEDVVDAQDLIYKIRASQVGDTVTLTLLRSGHEMTLTVKLGSDV